MDSLPHLSSSLKPGNSNIPNHQSVGRNGSFWLPPKAGGSFESNLQRNMPEVKNSNNNTGQLTFNYKDPDQLNRLIMVIKANY